MPEAFAQLYIASLAALLSCGVVGEGATKLDRRSSSGDEGSSGEAGAGFEQAGGAGGQGGQGCPAGTLDSVHYVVTQDGEQVTEGDIPLTDPASTVSLLVGGLDPGEFHVTLSADVPEGCPVSCEGAAPFLVQEGLGTNVTVDVHCSNEDEDGVLIEGTGPEASCSLDVVQYYTAVPLLADLDGTIALTTGAQDVNGEQPQFLWSASAGSIEDPASPTTTFHCDGALGLHTIGLRVSADVAEPGQSVLLCEQTFSFQVQCEALCGNGLIDAGETCDPGAPGDAECPPDCTLAVCGDGTVEGDETCEPPGQAGCDDACGAATAVCGNGVIETGEACEPPNSGDCDARCELNP